MNDDRRGRDLLESLAARNPVPNEPGDDGGIARAIDEIAAAIVTTPQVSQNRRFFRPRLVFAIVAAIFALATGVAAAAGVFSAHTGLYPTKAEEAVGGPGEALNPAAPDFRQVALGVASDIPYPEGYASWRDFLIADEIRTTAGSGVESTGALHGWFAASAFSAWLQAWRQAMIADDKASAAAAARMIAEAPSWKAVTDEDPHPNPSVPGDEGSHYSLFGWMLPYCDAVLAGDLARLDHLLAYGYGDKPWFSDPQWRAQLASHPDWGGLTRDELAAKYEQFLAKERS